jgi:hypothetical protein
MQYLLQVASPSMGTRRGNTRSNLAKFNICFAQTKCACLQRKQGKHWVDSVPVEQHHQRTLLRLKVGMDCDWQYATLCPWSLPVSDCSNVLTKVRSAFLPCMDLLLNVSYSVLSNNMIWILFYKLHALDNQWHFIWLLAICTVLVIFCKKCCCLVLWWSFMLFIM